MIRILLYLFKPFYIGTLILGWISGYLFSEFYDIRKGKKTIAFIFFLMTFLALFFKRQRPYLMSSQSVREIVVFASYTWIGIVLIIFFVSILFALFFKYAEKHNKHIPPTVKKMLPLSIVIILVSIASYCGLKQPVLHHIEIVSEYMPDSLDGYRIVQLGDIHLDSVARMNRFRRSIPLINSVGADIVLMTGDIIDPGIDTSEASDGFFNAIEAKDGIYTCLGNHESYYDARGDSQALLRRMGLKILHNESMDLPLFRLTGIGDIGTEELQASYVAGLVGRQNDNNKPEIVLSHQPKYYKEIAKKKPLLVLSGHTHAGQIFPFSLYTKLLFPYFYGHYVIDDTHFYVTSGVFGWGPRMRLLSSSEIPVITLRKKQ